MVARGPVHERRRERAHDDERALRIGRQALAGQAEREHRKNDHGHVQGESLDHGRHVLVLDREDEPVLRREHDVQQASVQQGQQGHTGRDQHRAGLALGTGQAPDVGHLRGVLAHPRAHCEQAGPPCGMLVCASVVTLVSRAGWSETVIPARSCRAGREWPYGPFRRLGPGLRGGPAPAPGRTRPVRVVRARAGGPR